MRILFCGTSEFAVPSLRACNARHEVVGVVTQPARSGSRGKPAPRPVADLANQLGLKLLQPVKVRTPDASAELLACQADVMVVAAFGQIIPGSLLDAHRYGGINVHGSLLPRWRGAAPIARAILAGDIETGVSIMQMDAGLDTGAVFATRSVAITSSTTASELTEALAIAGAEELVAVLAGVERGTSVAVAQSEDGVLYAAKLSREDGRLNLSERSAVEADRMVRALWPWPGVTASIAGLEVGILEGTCVESSSGIGEVSPGDVVSTRSNYADVATREGVYRVTRVKPPGKQAMDAGSFLRGRR